MPPPTGFWGNFHGLLLVITQDKYFRKSMLVLKQIPHLRKFTFFLSIRIFITIYFLCDYKIAFSATINSFSQIIFFNCPKEGFAKIFCNRNSIKICSYIIVIIKDKLKNQIFANLRTETLNTNYINTHYYHFATNG